MAAPDFGAIFAAMVAIINTKLPAIGLLVLARCLKRLRRALKRADTKTSAGKNKEWSHITIQSTLLERPVPTIGND